jgi:hypothetical protein
MKSRYHNIYNRFIATRPHRTKTLNDELEVHHILPRSLGGTDDATNLVTLTPREHFFAHLLLARFKRGSDRLRMVVALWQMSNQPKNRSHITARQYDTIRRQFIQTRRAEWRIRKQDPAQYQQYIESLKRGHRNMDPVRRKLASDRMRAYWRDPVQRAQRIANIQKKSRANAQQNSRKSKEWYQTPEGLAYRKRLSEHMKRVNAQRSQWAEKRNNSFRRYVANMTEEQRELLRTSGRKGRASQLNRR